MRKRILREMQRAVLIIQNLEIPYVYVDWLINNV